MLHDNCKPFVENKNQPNPSQQFLISLVRDLSVDFLVLYLNELFLSNEQNQGQLVIGRGNVLYQL